MTKTQLRRIAAIGGSLAVMAVGGGYATGAFAHGGTPARVQVRLAPATHHQARTAAGAASSRHLELGHAAAAEDPAEDPTDEPTEDPGDDDQGENSDDQGENSDDQGDDNSGNDTGSDSGDDNGGDQGGDGNGD
jgi:hypothetical protein